MLFKLCLSFLISALVHDAVVKAASATLSPGIVIACTDWNAKDACSFHDLNRITNATGSCIDTMASTYNCRCPIMYEEWAQNSYCSRFAASCTESCCADASCASLHDPYLEAPRNKLVETDRCEKMNENEPWQCLELEKESRPSQILLWRSDLCAGDTPTPTFDLCVTFHFRRLAELTCPLASYTDVSLCLYDNDVLQESDDIETDCYGSFKQMSTFANANVTTGCWQEATFIFNTLSDCTNKVLYMKIMKGVEEFHIDNLRVRQVTGTTGTDTTVDVCVEGIDEIGVSTIDP